MNRPVRPDRVITLPSGRGEALAEALREALKGARRREAVLVADPDAWCEVVEVAASTAQGDATTLAKQLAYEAETFSSIKPEAALLAWRRESMTGELAAFRVVEFARDELVAAVTVARSAGVRLVGFTHPSMGEIAVTPPPVPVTAFAVLRRSAVVLALTVAVLAAVEAYRGSCRAERREALARLEELREDCAAVERRAAADRSHAAALRRRLESEVRGELRALKARRSYARILEALADTCPEGGMVSSIRSAGDFTLAIEGCTVTAADAESFLRSLGAALRPGGFAVATLSLDSLNQLPGGGPWSFRCRIEPVRGEVCE